MAIFIAILIFLAVAGATWWFGLWSNLITLVNLLLAASIASSVYQPVANGLLHIDKSFALLVDFVAVWLAFVVAFGVLRTATDSLSSYRLKFDLITEMTGRTILSLWIASVFVCFTFFTLQMAPVKPGFFGDDSPGRGKLAGTFMDRAWLSYLQSRSRGALSSSRKENLLFGEYKKAKVHPDDVGLDARVFDPFSVFPMAGYFHRREISDRETLRLPVAKEEQQ